LRASSVPAGFLPERAQNAAHAIGKGRRDNRGALSYHGAAPFFAATVATADHSFSLLLVVRLEVVVVVVVDPPLFSLAFRRGTSLLGGGKKRRSSRQE